MPSPTCAGSGAVFDCTEGTSSLRCPECAELIRVVPRKTFSFAVDPAWDRNMQGSLWRALLPNHPPRRK